MPSAIILSGGNSNRINADKAFLELTENKTIIENITKCLKEIFSEIIIVANNVDDYRFLGYKVIPDLIKNKGPLGGIYAGLKAIKEDNGFVLACDMPFVNIDLIRYMLRFREFDAVVPRFDGYIEPLHAVYSKNILPMIEEQIKSDELKIRETVKRIKKIKYIEKEEIEKFDKGKLCFFNINDKESLEKAREMVKEKDENRIPHS